MNKRMLSQKRRPIDFTKEQLSEALVKYLGSEKSFVDLTYWPLIENNILSLPTEFYQNNV